MKTAELFQWVELIKDVPESDFHQGDQGVIVELLEPNENEPETGYLLEIFQDGETLDVIAVPASWTKPLKPSITDPVTISPDIMHGTPVFTGTRVPIQTLLDYLKTGENIDGFLEGFPTVQKEQVLQLLDLMAASVLQKN